MTNSLFNNIEIQNFINRHNTFLMNYFYYYNHAFKKVIDKHLRGISGLGGTPSETEDEIRKELNDKWWFSFDDVLFVVFNTRIKRSIALAKRRDLKRNASVMESIAKRYPVCEWWCDLGNSSICIEQLEYIVLKNKTWFGEMIVKAAEVSNASHRQQFNDWAKKFKDDKTLCSDPEFWCTYTPEFKINVKSLKAFIADCNKHGMSTDDEIRQNVFNALRQHLAWADFCTRLNDETMLADYGQPTDHI